MNVKLFEIRDDGTFIPAMAVQLCARSDEERYLLRRSGYAQDEGYIMLTRLETGAGQFDPYEWPGPARTMKVAHQYIVVHWHKIKSGDVIDVEFLLGERTEVKQSERVTDQL